MRENATSRGKRWYLARSNVPFARRVFDLESFSCDSPLRSGLLDRIEQRRPWRRGCVQRREHHVVDRLDRNGRREWNLQRGGIRRQARQEEFPDRARSTRNELS